LEEESRPVPEAKRTIAAFDFDGTITTRDTFIDLLIRTFGAVRFAAGCLRLSPVLAMYKIGLVPNNVAKERLFSHFFASMDVSTFRGYCDDYSLNRVNGIASRSCLERVDWHRGQGHELVIVSASIDDWIRPWALRNHFSRVIATHVETRQGRLTGRFSTANCYGIRKVERFLSEYPGKDSYYLYYYGDSRGDSEMILLADVGTIAGW